MPHRPSQPFWREISIVNVEASPHSRVAGWADAVADESPRVGAALPERVLLVEEHELLAQSLAAALQAEGVAASKAPLDSREAIITLARQVTPDMALLDVDLGELGPGLPLIEPLRDAGVRVVILTAVADQERLAECVEAGAIGLISKREGFEGLLAAMREAMALGSLLKVGQREELMAELRRQRKQRQERLACFQRLTARERQVLAALVNGNTATDIADEWYVALSTVRTQIRSVLSKLGVSSQIAAIGLAHRTGWSAR